MLKHVKHLDHAWNLINALYVLSFTIVCTVYFLFFFFCVFDYLRIFCLSHLLLFIEFYIKTLNNFLIIVFK